MTETTSKLEKHYFKVKCNQKEGLEFKNTHYKLTNFKIEALEFHLSSKLNSTLEQLHRLTLIEKSLSTSLHNRI